MALKNQPFNVALEPSELTDLTTLAKRLKCSKGAVIRLAVSNLYKMVVLNSPICASGQRCYVPHMHPPVPPVYDLPGQAMMNVDPSRPPRQPQPSVPATNPDAYHE